MNDDLPVLGECALCFEPAVTQIPMDLRINDAARADEHVVELVKVCATHAAEERRDHP